MKGRKAVIPVAGFGVRFLPATRSVPKALFPIFDTPPVLLAVQEAADAGITDVSFVVSSGQEAIGAYFDTAPDLERALAGAGDDATLGRMRAISEMVETRAVLQEERAGLGDAVLLSRDAVGHEPFAVLLPDDVIWSEVPTIGTMMEMSDNLGGAVIAINEVPDQMVPSLGIIESEPIGERVHRVTGMMEKPDLADAPSNLAIIGRYVLPPEIFEIIEATRPGAKGEVQLTDAISGLLPEPGVYAYEFPGAHFDVGTPTGLLKASVYSALQRDEHADDLRRWLADQI